MATEAEGVTYKNGTWAYGDWRMERNRKPIPLRAYDWDYWHIDYDGPEDRRAGHAGSLGECLEHIIFQEMS